MGASRLAGSTNRRALGQYCPIPRARQLCCETPLDVANRSRSSKSQRSLVAILTVAVSPLLVLLLTPFIRPFTWTRIIFTYAIPALPLFILFDGLVSCLRSYSPEELLQLASRADAPGFAWESGTLATRTPLPVTYLVGYPADDPRGTAA